MPTDPGRYTLIGTVGSSGYGRIGTFRTALSCINCGDGINGGASNLRCGTRVVDVVIPANNNLCGYCGCGYGAATTCHDGIACGYRDPGLPPDARCLPGTITCSPATAGQAGSVALTVVCGSVIDKNTATLDTVRIYNAGTGVQIGILTGIAFSNGDKTMTISKSGNLPIASYKWWVSIWDINGNYTFANSAFTVTS